MWHRTALALGLVTLALLGNTACSSSSDNASACRAIQSIDTTALLAQVSAASLGDPSFDATVMKDIAAKLNGAAELASDALRTALMDAASIANNIAANNADPLQVMTTFTRLGKEVDNACGSGN